MPISANFHGNGNGYVIRCPRLHALATDEGMQPSGDGFRLVGMGQVTQDRIPENP